MKVESPFVMVLPSLPVDPFLVVLRSWLLLLSGVANRDEVERLNRLFNAEDLADVLDPFLAWMDAAPN